MREIKFRAFDKVENKMIYNLQDRCGLKEDLKCVNHIIMQYIGLKDKNGKEIYEGDILIYNFNEKIQIFNILQPKVSSKGYQITEIGFNISSFSSRVIKQENSYFGDLPSNWEPIRITISEYRQIIGNLYENPELIKETNNAK